MCLRGQASAGAKSRARIGPKTAIAAVCVAQTLVACTTPAVSARAVWIGSERDADGSRTMFAYAAGAITASRVSPLTQDAESARLPVMAELEPRGRGALVRAVDGGWLHDLSGVDGVLAGYVDLAHSRALPLWLPAGVDSARFIASGDALWWFDGCPRALAVLPLAAEVPTSRETHGEVSTVAPMRRTIGGPGKPGQRAGCTGSRSYGVASASDAPVMVVLTAQSEGLDQRAREAAEIEVLRVPTSASEPQRLEPIALGALPAGHLPLRMPRLHCPPGGACGVGAVDPDGAAVSVAVYGGGCRLLRWEAATGEALCVIAEDAAPELRTEQLVAAVSAEHYVFVDGLTVHRYDWRKQELSSRAVPGDLDEAFTRVTADGRVVVVGSTGGPVLRADAGSLDPLSIVQSLCSNPQQPVVSPSGRFVAWTCTLGDELSGEGLLDDGPEQDALALGDVVRVSDAGLDRFQGVPMWALAIDDAGDLLMHSRSNTRINPETLLPIGPPRNLYVLAGDGELARIDGLEPDPEQTLGLAAGTHSWITARSY
jgi:hypothetical protein